MPAQTRPVHRDGVEGRRGPPADYGAILDDLPPATPHFRIFWLICAIIFVDFYDLAMGGAIAASLLRDGWTTLALNSLFFSAAGVGAAIGVLAAGFLADRIGRIRVLQWGLALMAAGTLGCAAAPSMAALILARTVAAIGMGALPTIGYVYLNELLPARVRGSWISGLGVTVAASSSLASIAAYYLLPMGAWRLMFILPAVLGLALMVALHGIPESPRWLAVRRQWDRAAAELARVTRTPVAPPQAAPAAAPAAAAEAGSARALLRPPLIGPMILGTGLAVGATVTSNSAVAWMPTVLLASGTVEHGLGDNIVVMLGAPLGSVTGYFIVDRVSRRGAVAVTALLATLLAAACAFLGRDAGLIPVAFVLMAAINFLCTLILGVYLPELFPTSLRARGSALALTVSRVTLIIVPLALAMILAAHGGTGLMLFLAACFAAMGLLVAGVGVETASRSLDA